jgi:hypothetical protein
MPRRIIMAALLLGLAMPAQAACEKSKAQCPKMVEFCKSNCDAFANSDRTFDTARCKKACDDQYPICEELACLPEQKPTTGQ